MSEPIIAANHPATRGVKPFELTDEWYFHLRLRDDVIPLLQAHPPAGTLGRPAGLASASRCASRYSTANDSGTSGSTHGGRSQINS